MLSAAAVTTHDSRSPQGFGVRTHYMVSALARRFEPFYFVGPLGYDRRTMALGRLKHQYFQRRGEIYRLSRDRRAVQGFGRQVDDALSSLSPDVVISPVSSGSSPLAYATKTGIRVLWTDITFHNYVEESARTRGSRLSSSHIRDGYLNERSMLRSTDIACFASEWAAASARAHYADDIDGDRIHVVPFGPNLADIPSDSQVNEMILQRPRDRCVITFVGFEWERKGGPLVLGAAEILRSRGIQVDVNLVGVEPPVAVPPYVHAFGPLGHSTSGTTPTLTALLASSHFLMVPSRAEGFGHVYAEAAALGIPSIATAVGGVTTAVVDGETGRLLDLTAEASDYADEVERIWTRSEHYESLARGARRYFRSTLDWDVGSTTVASLCENLIGS